MATKRRDTASVIGPGREDLEPPLPITTDLSADELIVRLGAVGDSVQILVAAQPWLMGRSSLPTARELLLAAEGASATARLAAIELVSAFGEPVSAAWQELLDAPRVGPHARAALADWDRDPELPESDRRRIAVDAASAALTRTGPDEALSCVCEWLAGDLQSRIALVADSDHPDAGALAQALTTFVDSGEPRTIDQVLHRIIQVLFEWDGDHLHVFDVGGRRYADPYSELDDPAIRSEFGLRLAAAFTPSGKKVKYTYDFGACWRHEIVMERVVERNDEQLYPACVAFNGDSPLEYWSEDDPQDQEAFDLGAVNHQLALRFSEDDHDDRI